MSLVSVLGCGTLFFPIEEQLFYLSAVKMPFILPIRAIRAFRTQCDQAVAQDAAVQAYVRQLEQDYDATGDEMPHRRRDDDFNPEPLMHELENFLRQERERGAE